MMFDFAAQAQQINNANETTQKDLSTLRLMGSLLNFPIIFGSK
jgi:hypothetical protein